MYINVKRFAFSDVTLTSEVESDRNSVSVFGFGDKSSRMWTFGAYSVSAEYEAKFFGFRPNNGCCIRSTPITVQLDYRVER